MAYIGTTPKDIRSFGKAKFDFTATQGQTAFTGSDDDGKTLGYTTGQITVYLNGILLDESDYTASGSNTVTLASAANASDIISVVALQTDIPNSDYVPATGGTFSGAVTHTGAFTSRGIDDNATSTAMTLDASGNLLVGKTAIDNTTAGHRLDASGFMSHVRAGNTIAVYNRLSSDGTLIDLRKDGTMVGGIGTNTNGNFQLYGAEASHVGLQFGSPSILPINNSGTSADNAVDLGDSNVRFKDLYLSGGVYLGGTGAANLLDDYEEGTWTPTAPTGWTITSQYTYYVKVGNLVTVKAKIFIDGESTGSFSVSGLPFTGLTGLAQMAGPVMYEQISFGGAGDVLSFVESGVSRLDFWYMSNSGGAWTQWTSAETTTNTEIYVNATYVTNT